MSEQPTRLVAITGATGFIGRHLVSALARDGWRVRLLMRRDPVGFSWHDVEPEIVAGSMSDEAALVRLVEGVDAVIHVAGLIKATSREQFMSVNRDGSARLATIAKRHAPAAHFMLVSSLASREPSLSDYAASKRAGEDAVLEIIGRGVTVVRPPVVYGPGDRETLLFFQLASRRLVPLLGSPTARAAMIHVDDLIALIVNAVGGAPIDGVMTPADDHPVGYRWDELLGAAARAVGNPSPRFVRAPQVLLSGAALLGDLATKFGSASMLSSQKLRELRHEDWGVSRAELPTTEGWAPRIDIDGGFADAVRWYRSVGWLPA